MAKPLQGREIIFNAFILLADTLQCFDVKTGLASKKIYWR